ncbi:MAG: GAF domain-containing protein [Tepidisphaeraceae bacterium]
MPDRERDLPTAPLPDELSMLRSIVGGVARSTGEPFLRSLVKNLAEVLGTRIAFIGRFEAAAPGEAPTLVRTIAFWKAGKFHDDCTWRISDTPCERLVSGNGLCHLPRDVCRQYPKEEGIESYLGVALRSASGELLGHLAVCDDRPMPDEPRRLSIFQIFAARAGAELERLDVARRLERSETLFRDLFDEAPIGYVYERLDSRFVRANRAGAAHTRSEARRRSKHGRLFARRAGTGGSTAHPRCV